jgi:hypothetical protein
LALADQRQDDLGIGFQKPAVGLRASTRSASAKPRTANLLVA